MTKKVMLVVIETCLATAVVIVIMRLAAGPGAIRFVYCAYDFAMMCVVVTSINLAYWRNWRQITQ